MARADVSCGSTEKLLQLVRLCETAQHLDEQVDSLEKMAEAQVQTVNTLQTRLKGNLQSLDKTVQSQRAGSEKLVQNSQTVMEWLGQEQELTSLFVKSSKELQGVWAEIKEMGPSLATMLDSLSAVTDIFEVLHILSINTAIEASRYGERGRSFSIIAREMRSLADRSRTFTDTIREQGALVHGRVQELMKKLATAMDVYSSLEKRVRRFLEDSRHVRDNTQAVLALIHQYEEFSGAQISEWKDSMERLGALGQSATELLERSRQIETMAERLFGMIQGETEVASHETTELHQEALEEARRITEDLSPSVLFDRVQLDGILREHSEQTPLFELLYVLDATGRQVSCNIYAPRYRTEHEACEGYGELRAHKEYYQIPMKKGEAYVSPVYLSSATRALCITVALPLFSEGSCYGVLCADVDLRYLAEK
ncbi:MAG TPA: methyl-accepting chemotaxis protein [Termitinemataceae bacterium]|nr:methyl-accepting chemotaxis protein [Termitinemataceae bacterium]HPP99805.1 methyl-accepting chemotaxis protein [Termitinemataceae bacterium]